MSFVIVRDLGQDGCLETIGERKGFVWLGWGRCSFVNGRFDMAIPHLAWKTLEGTPRLNMLFHFCLSSFTTPTHARAPPISTLPSFQLLAVRLNCRKLREDAVLLHRDKEFLVAGSRGKAQFAPHRHAGEQRGLAVHRISDYECLPQSLC